MERTLVELAYIDPATGAMVLQIIAAGVLTAGVYFRRLLSWPFALLFRKHRRAASTGTPPSNTPA